MAKKGRSPSYPSLNLEMAIDRANAIYKKERNNWIPLETAVIDWGLTSTTGVGAVSVAALKYYGLMEDQGAAEDRKVRLTDFALRIIRDERSVSPDKNKAIQEAALKPKVFQELWNRYPGARVSDATLRTHLKNNMGYLDDAAEAVVKRFREVLEFSGLGRESDDLSDLFEPEDEPPVEKGEETMAIAQEEIQEETKDDGEEIKTYSLELPFQVKGKSSRFSIKVPYPMDWTDWERMKGILDSILGEVIPGKPKN